jgi:hypothetical protein
VPFMPQIMENPTLNLCRELREMWLIGGSDSSLGLLELKMTVGEAGHAVVLNALRGTSRIPYLSPEFCGYRPVTPLIREGLQAEDLNAYGDRVGAVGVCTG